MQESKTKKGAKSEWRPRGDKAAVYTVDLAAVQPPMEEADVYTNFIIHHYIQVKPLINQDGSMIDLAEFERRVGAKFDGIRHGDVIRLRSRGYETACVVDGRVPDAIQILVGADVCSSSRLDTDNPYGIKFLNKRIRHAAEITRAIQSPLEFYSAETGAGIHIILDPVAHAEEEAKARAEILYAKENGYVYATPAGNAYHYAWVNSTIDRDIDGDN